jgi:hypothetical protein
MNEQIKELAEKAAQQHGHTIKFSNEITETLNSFAELIIKECIRVPYDMWDKAELNADIAVKIENRIRNHFGDEG